MRTGPRTTPVIAVSAPGLADDPKDPLLSKSAAARAKDKARNAKCLSNLRQCGLGVNLYLGDFDGRMMLDGLTSRTENDDLF